MFKNDIRKNIQIPYVDLPNLGSEEMKEHFKRLAKDKEYRKRYKTATSSRLEKQQQEIEHKLFKTLADSL